MPTNLEKLLAAHSIIMARGSVGGKKLTVRPSAERRAQHGVWMERQGRAVMRSLQGEVPFASSSRLTDNFSGAESNGMLREGPSVWVRQQLVAGVLERGGIQWKSPLILSTFLNV